MPDKVKENEVLQIVEQIREKAEKFGTDSAEFKEFSEKTQETLDSQEAKNATVVKDLAEERKMREDLGEKFDSLQVEMARKASGGKNDYKDTPEYKALNLYASKGEDAFDAEQKALLRSDDDTAGGYLTTSEVDSVIIRNITEISPVRQVSRVRTVGKKTLELPKRTGIPVATYEGEAVSGSDSESTYGTETMTCHRLTTTVPFTMDMLLASNFDIESEIAQDVAESFAQKEGLKFVLGTGSKEPEGFLVDASVVAGARETGTSSVISGDDLIAMTGDLKTGYNPMYGFNRRTLANLRTLKGGDGQYLWQIGLASGAPNTIAGEPYIVMEDMPDIAVGALPVVYADFMRGYTITDRTGTAVIRDQYSQKRKNIIELTFHRYNTGQVVLQEAFKALKIKA